MEGPFPKKIAKIFTETPLRLFVTTPLCISCGSNKWEADVVLMTGKWSRLINYSNKKYDVISCVNCGYTMLFKKDANFSPLELMFG